MSKSVLISIQPYWVFLIIAKAMGWNIDKEKTVEVRKSYPKDENWNKVVKIYCSKDKKSFAKIPKEYQPFMKPLLGKVPGEFVSDRCDEFTPTKNGISFRRFSALAETRLSVTDMRVYLRDKVGYGWHISDLVIYDEPKELSEFKKIKRECWYAVLGIAKRDCPECKNKGCFVTRPPQSWCYVEDMEGEK